MPRLAVIAVASVDAGGGSVRRLGEHVPVDSELPLSILNYVRHSRVHVLLNDDGQPSPFAADAYLAARPLKSILCLPILRQAELIGILHRSRSRNAQLYSDLRRENSERQQVDAALRESQALLPPASRSCRSR